ncbi:MAG: restriction endonuclease subunit S [Deltaproteobacteria bacterium]|nr:restriction endonuclease subunit S [Deltaproteobacteria bacterium]
MKAKGKISKDDKWKKKYNEPQKPSEFYLDLPTSWIEVRAEQICDFITKGTTPKAIKLYSDKGEIPFIKVYNLTNTGRLDFSIKPTFISNDTNENELARSRVYPGDVLMNIVGPPLGKISVIPNSFGEWNINQAIAIFRAMPSYKNLLLSYFLLSDTVLSWAVRRAKATAGQFNLTLEICRNLPIPVPPAEEQVTIIKLLEQLFTIIDGIEKEVDRSLIRADRLRQSVLKKAFAGKLVSRNNNDESAKNPLKRSA